ncbi:hypothetical protein Tco_0343506 [Tanacetum coccineum]
MQVNVQFLQQLHQTAMVRICDGCPAERGNSTVSYTQPEVQILLALLAAAQPYSDNYYQAPKPQRSNAPSYMQSSSTTTSATTGPKATGSPPKPAEQADGSKTRMTRLINKNGSTFTVTWQKIQEDNKNDFILKQLKKANASLTQELKECKTNLDETSRALGEATSSRDSCLIALQTKQTELEKYTALNDRTRFCPNGEETVTLEKESRSKLDKDKFSKLEKHSISLELALQQCKEQMKNNSVCKENGSNVFRKEHEQYHEIQDLKAQMQDKNIAISELKKLIEMFKRKGVDTNFEQPSILGKPPVQSIRNQPVVRQPTGINMNDLNVTTGFASQVDILSRPFLNVQMTFEQRSSSLVLHQMMSDHNSSDLAPQRQEMSVENVSSGLVPSKDKSVRLGQTLSPCPQTKMLFLLAGTTDSSQQGLEFLFSPLLEGIFTIQQHGLA